MCSRELGVPDLPAERLGPCLDSVGITFLHAARHHPAMARVAPVRRALGRRTIFNLLGPLANPAGVTRQLVGVFSPDVLQPMAEALHALGSSHAAVVHGDGYDELTVTGDSHIAVLADGRITTAPSAPKPPTSAATPPKPSPAAPRPITPPGWRRFSLAKPAPIAISSSSTRRQRSGWPTRRSAGRRRRPGPRTPSPAALRPRFWRAGRSFDERHPG